MRVERALLLALGAGLFLLACGGDSADGSYLQLTSGEPEFETLPIQFDEFTLYWVGSRINDYDLRYIIRDDRQENLVSFSYGECEFPAGEEGCPPPLTIVIEPYCMDSPPAGYRGRPTGLETVRGGAETNGSRIWTGGVVIRLFANEIDFDDVVEALVSSNGGVEDADEPLPPPEIDCAKVGPAGPA